jgi:hypothetical protein
MIKLSQLVDPKILVCEAEEKELPEEFTVFERGFEFLKQRIAELNKKAAKYKVPPLEIIIHKEEMTKVLRPEIKAQIQAGSLQFGPGVLNSPEGEVYWTLAKKYTLSIKGEPPHVEGYEFIARLEHTPEGNFIYTSPHSSVPNLPAEFKTVNQHCDVCHTNRDRNDTFVVKMEKDDPERFPDKKAGDLLVVGRNCLARFMPGISVSGLIAYTNMVEATQFDVKEAAEMDEFEGGGGGGGKYYEPAEHLLFWIAATYLYSGRYMSKSQANKNYEAGMTGPMIESTISRALSEMRPNPLVKNPHQAYPIYYKVKEDPDFVKKVEELCKEFEAWFPTKDWEKMAQEKPDKADFIHNMALVGKQDYLKSQYFGFYSALFQFFLRDKKGAEDAAAAKKAQAELPPSPVDFSDPSLVGKKLKDIAKEAEIKRLAAGGMDEKAIKKAIKGKLWGWEVTCKKIKEQEQTQSFGYGNPGIAQLMWFNDAFGNEFFWWGSTNPGFTEGGKYLISATIIRYELPNNYHPNKPQVRINRVNIIQDLQNPSAPIPPVVAM